jgi:glycosyltransferase involved in cell wall biosynthesis
MKICYITAEYPPRIGGVGDYVRHLSRKMVARRHDVTVVTSAGLGEVSDTEDKYSPRVLPVIKRWNLLHLPVLLKILAAVDADVYILEYVIQMYGRGGFAPWLIVFFAAFGFGRKKRLILSGHELYLYQKGSVKKYLISFLTRLIFYAGIAASERVVVTNTFRAELISGFPGVTNKQIVVIPVGANVLPEFWPSPKAKKEAVFEITSFGIWSSMRPVKLLLEVIRELRFQYTLRLTLLGKVCSDGHGLDTLRTFMTTSEMVSTVEIKGVLTARELSDYLSRSDLFISTLDCGPSGRRGSLAAALAHGLPIVAFEGYERDPFFRNNDNIVLVPKGDVSALTRAIRRLIEDDDMRARLAFRARETYDKYLSWERIADRWSAILHDQVFINAPN